MAQFPTHTIVREGERFKIKRLASGCTYGDFDTWAEALEAMTLGGIATGAHGCDPANY